MFTIIFDIISWITDLPVVSQAFSSLVKFNELLKLEVWASKSILKPVDALSLDYETKDHSSELYGHVFDISIPGVHVDTWNESPEACVVKESNGVFVFLTGLVQLNKGSWESDAQAEDQYRELNVPEFSSEINEFIKCFVLVSLGD